MGSISRLPGILTTLGTVLAASAGAFLVERVITWDWDVKLVWAVLVLFVGGGLFWVGTRYQANQARRLGVFMSAFAVGPDHELEKITQETATFAAWATALNPLARMVPPRHHSPNSE